MKLRHFFSLFILVLFSTTFFGCSLPWSGSDEGDTKIAVAEKLVFVGEENKQYNLYLAKEDGSGIKKITDLNNVDGLIKPLWSPDASKIVFQAREKKGSKLYVINADGSDLTDITREVPEGGKNPQWLDDNHVLFLTKKDGYEGIYTIDVEGVNFIKVVDRVNGEFAFLKSQNAVIYQNPKTLALEKTSMETKKDENILVIDSEITNLQPSPKDSQFAFVKKKSKKKFILSVLDFENNLLSELITFDGINPFEEQFDLAWIQDASRLVFTFDSDNKQNTNEIALIGITDKRIIPLTTGKTNDIYLSSSLSQDRILFVRDQDGDRSLINLDLTSQEETELIPSQYNPISSNLR